MTQNNCVIIKQGQRMDIQETLQILSLKDKRSSTMSYQISQDLQSNHQNDSPQSQPDQITFDLVCQDGGKIEKRLNMDGLKQIKQNYNRRSPSMFHLLKIEDQLNDGQRQQINNNKNYSEKKKSSIQTIKQLKSKILAQKQPDKFSKKYIDMFDEIFFKKEANKQKQHSKQLTLDDKQSFLSTKNEHLSTARTIQSSIGSITSIIQDEIHHRLANNSDLTIYPKFITTHQQKACQQMQNPTQNGNKTPLFTPKTKINFTYGIPQQQSLRNSIFIARIQCP